MYAFFVALVFLVIFIGFFHFCYWKRLTKPWDCLDAVMCKGNLSVCDNKNFSVEICSVINRAVA
jgi:hypothetical protein